MAQNPRFPKAEFDALLKDIQAEASDLDFLPPNMRSALEKVKKTFENFRKSRDQVEREPQRVRSKKGKFNTEETHLAASRALWVVCNNYLHDATLGLNRFEETFIALGINGYKKFRSEVETIVLAQVQGVLEAKHMSAEEQEEVRHHYTKKDGWVDMALLELPRFAMDNVVKYLDKGVGDAEPSDPLINQWGLGKRKREILERWSQFMKDVRSGSSVRVVGEKNDGLAIIQKYTSKKKEICPSRIAGGQKQLLFIEKEQVIQLRKLGEGSFGTVHICTLQNISYIPAGTECCVKTWLRTHDQEQRQKLAIHEAIMGGLDHMGIVSAFAMTTSDPPQLVYDYYNGGTLRDMVDCVRKSHWPSSETPEPSTAKQTRAKIDLFMRNRLQICFAILEALEFFHSQGRLHNDLHTNNVLLHFKYDVEGSDEGVPQRVYVGICDFGRSIFVSQAKSDPSLRMWALKETDVEPWLRKYPNLAPEIVSTKPGPYTKATDIWALGNLFEIILLNKTCWAKETLRTQILCPGWEAAVMQPKLSHLIGTMKEEEAKNRQDCGYYGSQMYQYFRHVGIKRNNAEFFRE